MVNTSEKLKPKLFSVMKHYNGAQFAKDVIAGIIVAIIALPLSIALALASGVGPEQGIYTAIVAGFVIALFGGSRVQIAGPTAAFATIVAGIVMKYGMEGLTLATIMAGIILIIMGLCRFGSLLKYIPSTVTAGFTFGIALTILIGQIKDFMGITFTTAPVETMDKVVELVKCMGTFNYQALIVGVVCLAIMIVWPKKLKIIPPSLVAVIVGALVVKFMNLNVNTIGDLYTISSDLPHFALPVVTLDKIRMLLPDAFTIAVLAGIESLLSCVVSDGMIGSRHRSNMELIAEGLGNTASALFGGIPATGALARTAANVKNGGRTPVAGIVHSIVLLLILKLLMPYAALIPMPTIAAILFIVAYNMSGWRTVMKQIKQAPKSDIAVLITTLVLTVIFDIVVAIGVGLVLEALLFMKRMAEVTDVHGWVYVSGEETDAEDIALKIVPKNTRVFEINGPIFFAASEKFMEVLRDKSQDILIIRMRSVPAMDASGITVMEQIYEECVKNKITLVLSHVNEQPFKTLTKSGLLDKIGEDNLCANIDDALARAEVLNAEKNNISKNV